MKTYGIRIFDGRENILIPILGDVLAGIERKPSYKWCVLFLSGMPRAGEGEFLVEYEKQINHSESGLLVSYEDLEKLSGKFFQMFEIVVLGSENIHFLRRYKEDKVMYQTCEIVIELIDCAFWEVYVKDERIIDRLKKKFVEIELLDEANGFL